MQSTTFAKAKVEGAVLIVERGGFAMASRDRRSSAWRVLIEATLIADVLMLIEAFMNPGDFTPLYLPRGSPC